MFCYIVEEVYTILSKLSEGINSNEEWTVKQDNFNNSNFDFYILWINILYYIIWIGSDTLKSELNGNEFVEVLQNNGFREKFNIPKEQNILNIAYATLDFIKKNSDVGGVPLHSLSTLLKVYGISIASYFSFLETIKDINFNNKQYNDFLTNEYKNLFREIDMSDIDDLEKLKYKMEALKIAEESKKSSERNNIVLTSIITAGTVAVVGIGGYVYCKKRDSEIELAKIAAKPQVIKDVCGVIKVAATCASGLVGKFIP